MVLGFMIPFWGVLAPPGLAVVHAYKRQKGDSSLL
jgi:hypothetical protein